MLISVLLAICFSWDELSPPEDSNGCGTGALSQAVGVQGGILGGTGVMLS